MILDQLRAPDIDQTTYDSLTANYVIIPLDVHYLLSDLETIWALVIGLLQELGYGAMEESKFIAQKQQINSSFFPHKKLLPTINSQFANLPNDENKSYWSIYIEYCNRLDSIISNVLLYSTPIQNLIVTKTEMQSWNWTLEEVKQMPSLIPLEIPEIWIYIESEKEKGTILPFIIFGILALIPAIIIAFKGKE